MSGVGISFGADRIFDVMEELALFPTFDKESTQLLLINFGVDDVATIKMVSEFRNAGINAEAYPSAAKLKKQMSYADAKAIPYVLFLGEEEMASQKFNLKNMASGEQISATVADVIAKLA
jgi:histidyl-tRNA synthetase